MRVLAFVMLSACGGSEPTWSEDIRPIVASQCVGCHHEGGSGPFAMQTYEEASALGPVAALAVASRSMPPWMPDRDCRTFEGERHLTDDQIALFEGWVDSGMLEGEPTVPLVVQAESFASDLVGSPVEPYTPEYQTQTDDYHCFVLDLEFDETTYVSGSRVFPGSESVHHVLVYALTGDQITAMEAADAAEPGPGYTCFGGPLPLDAEGGGLIASGLPTQIGAWVPGVEAFDWGEAGMRIDAGAKVVMQVHYSAAGGAPIPDQTQLELALRDDEPSILATTRPMAIRTLDIPAGDDTVSFTSAATNFTGLPVTIKTMAAHMHLLGERQTVRVLRADGVEECALDIPEWDFDWQQSYRLPQDELLVIEPGDALELTCVYDNSAENQPVINGERQAPRDVAWGDGTLDEMCLTYFTFLEDSTVASTSPATECGDAQGCVDDCTDGDLECLLTCEEASVTCLSCALTAGTTCGLQTCALNLLTARDCVETCGLGDVTFGGGLGPCLAATCPDAIASLSDCAQPTLDAGSCDEALDECGIRL